VARGLDRAGDALVSVGARARPAISEARAALDLFLSEGDRPGANQARALLDEFGADQ
jgi:hypothetical protein